MRTRVSTSTPARASARGCFIDHGTGVVIGETAVLGERVRIYQNVTLGAKSFPTDGDGNLLKGQPRHPIVEDEAVIYAGSDRAGPHHHRSWCGHRRQCVAHAQRRAGQRHHAGGHAVPRSGALGLTPALFFKGFGGSGATCANCG